MIKTNESIKKHVVLKYFILVVSLIIFILPNTSTLRMKYHAIRKNINKIQIVDIKNYHSGIKVYSDRQYYDTLMDSSLDIDYVIQLPRHYKKDILINAPNDIIIYRSIAKENDNKIFAHWEKSDSKVYIKGQSSNHTELVFKRFDRGEIHLKSGGPKSASVIFIKNILLDSNLKITLVDPLPASVLEKFLKFLFIVTV